jgi:hypothetical protein
MQLENLPADLGRTLIAANKLVAVAGLIGGMQRASRSFICAIADSMPCKER